VWLQGDNTLNSTDSRSYGPVPYALLKGRAILRLRVRLPADAVAAADPAVARRRGASVDCKSRPASCLNAMGRTATVHCLTRLTLSVVSVLKAQCFYRCAGQSRRSRSVFVTASVLRSGCRRSRRAGCKRSSRRMSASRCGRAACHAHEGDAAISRLCSAVARDVATLCVALNRHGASSNPLLPWIHRGRVLFVDDCVCHAQAITVADGLP